MEAARDEIMRGVGTTEPWHEEMGQPIFGNYAISLQYRKPLRVDEVAQMRKTPAVRERRGRP